MKEYIVKYEVKYYVEANSKEEAIDMTETEDTEIENNIVPEWELIGATEE